MHCVVIALADKAATDCIDVERSKEMDDRILAATPAPSWSDILIVRYDSK